MKIREILNEKKKSTFKVMQDNKIALTKEERAIVKQKKGEWSDGNSAIWKGKDRSGKLWYVTHTHRAYNRASTLKGAINRFKVFIKGTA